MPHTADRLARYTQKSKGERYNMLRSMYSGISGLKNFQTKLDVIGNNISNVNTYGFKKGRVVFKDLVSQTQAGASGTSETRGGVNAKQVGLGSQLAAIDTIHGTGALQSTGRTLDLAIEGEGFFMVADSVRPTPATGAPANPATPATVQGMGNVLFTRAGNFYMDGNGYLVNGDGKYLVGIRNSTNEPNSFTAGHGLGSQFEADKSAEMGNYSTGTNIVDSWTLSTMKPLQIPTSAQSMNIGQDGTISFVDADGNLQYAGTIFMGKFPNAEGLEKKGGNYFSQTQNSGEAYVNLSAKDGIGTIQSGFLEMSNVDLSEEFTEMIVAQRGFQATSRIITTSDEILQELVNLKR